MHGRLGPQNNDIGWALNPQTNGLTHGWIYTWMGYWEVVESMRGGAWLGGSRTWEEYFLSLSLSHPFNFIPSSSPPPPRRRTTLLYHKVSALSWAQSKGSTYHRQKPPQIRVRHQGKVLVFTKEQQEYLHKRDLAGNSAQFFLKQIWLYLKYYFRAGVQLSGRVFSPQNTTKDTCPHL